MTPIVAAVLVSVVAVAVLPRAHALAGGEPTSPSEFPFMVAIFTNTPLVRGPGYHCAGVVLDSRHVMTAAHCVAMVTADQLVVAAGTNDVSLGPSSAPFTAPVCHIEVHPTFDVPVLVNDVAVLTLSTPLPPVVAPVQVEAAAPPAGTPVIAVGWGGTDTGLLPGSMVARKASMTVTRCDAVAVAGVHGEALGQLCATPPSNSRAGTCVGDSGGPLLAQQPDNSYALVGILSYQVSASCGDASPTLATTAAHADAFFRHGLGLPPATWPEDVCTYRSGVCPAGTLDNGVGGCDVCPGNTAAAEEWGLCVQCPFGHVAVASPDVTVFHGRQQPRRCQPCPSGTYHAVADDTFCTRCPTGFSTDGDAAISCDRQCPEGAPNPFPGTLQLQLRPHLDDYPEDTSVQVTRIDAAGAGTVLNQAYPFAVPVTLTVPQGVYWIAASDSFGDGSSHPPGRNSMSIDGYYFGDRDSRFTFTAGGLVGVGVDYCAGYQHGPRRMYTSHVVANRGHRVLHAVYANIDAVGAREVVYLDHDTATFHWYTVDLTPVTPRTRYRGATVAALGTDSNSLGTTHAADFTGDGSDEVLFVSRTGRLSWFGYNAAQERLNVEHVIMSDEDVMAAFPVDLDGDGNMDVVSADVDEVTIRTHLNANGNGQLWTTTVIAQLGSNFVSHVTAADVHGDGFVDIIVPNRDGLYLIPGLPGGNAFSSPIRIAQSTPVHRVRVADFDGDGSTDFVMTLFESNEVSVLFGPYTAFSPLVHLTNTLGGARALDVGDLDGDGDTDIVAAAFDEPRVLLWFNNNGAFGEPSELPMDRVPVQLIHDLEVIDGNQDGHMDVMISGLSGHVAWFLRDTGSSDAGSSDTGSSDTGSSDAGSSDASSSGNDDDDCDRVVSHAFWWDGGAVVDFQCAGCELGPIIGGQQFWRPPMAATAYQRAPVECLEQQ